MNYTPKWRLKFRHPPKLGPGADIQSEAFKAGRAASDFRSYPKCERIANSTGRRCGQPKMLGSRFCKHHGGYFKAVEAEQKRHPKFTVIVDRSRSRRKQALGALGSAGWPEGCPRRPELLELGPVARGRLFEAWYNRQMAPDVWKYELERERKRRKIQPNLKMVLVKSEKPSGRI
jgi:hypothetical protein